LVGRAGKIKLPIATPGVRRGVKQVWQENWGGRDFRNLFFNNKPDLLCLFRQNRRIERTGGHLKLICQKDKNSAPGVTQKMVGEERGILTKGSWNSTSVRE